MIHNLQHSLKGRRHLPAALLFFIFAGLAAAVSQAAQQPPETPLGAPARATAAVAPAPYELRVELVRPGLQKVILAARLEKNGGLIHRPVSWRVRTYDPLTARAGRLVHESSQPRAEVALPAGDYQLDIRYGYRHVRQRVRLRSGQYLYMTFILDVGGLRALPVVAEMGPLRQVRAVQRLYALDGRGRGRLVATWSQPGRILRLAAGSYRIVSRYLPGNARTESRVTVKPGILSSLKITAQAGMVHIRPGDGPSRWILRDAARTWRHSGTGEASLVLAPGQYVLETGKEPGRRFTIGAGKRREIVLAGSQ